MVCFEGCWGGLDLVFSEEWRWLFRILRFPRLGVCFAQMFAVWPVGLCWSLFVPHSLRARRLDADAWTWVAVGRGYGDRVISKV